MSIFVKVLNVITSCKTYRQCVVARRYLELSRLKSYHLDLCNDALLTVTNRCWLVEHEPWGRGIYTPVHAPTTVHADYMIQLSTVIVVIIALLLPFITVAIL
jgi:hypothetical protein